MAEKEARRISSPKKKDGRSQRLDKSNPKQYPTGYYWKCLLESTSRSKISQIPTKPRKNWTPKEEKINVV